MKFDFEKAYLILERTPAVLKALLHDLPDEWVKPNEGPDTFSPFDVMGHLINGEITDWTVRIKVILEKGADIPFPLFDRFAQYRLSEGKTLSRLLDEFAALRADNMNWLRALQLTEYDLERPGTHPVLGPVTLRNLLSTWVAHDLTHIAQITRVMAKQYKEEMGPWPQFFRILSF